MNQPFTFGVQTGPFDDRAALADHARKVEDLGYAELFSFDHIGAVDPFVPLVVAAEATTTLRLGPLVVNNELHHPALLARTAATFDALTGGRLVLGMGSGYMQSEHDATGILLRAPGPRVERFIESLDVIRALLDTGASTMHGTHIDVDIADLGVRPAQAAVPLLIGGHGRRMVELAATRADVFQYTGLTHHPVTGAPGAGGFSMDDLRARKGWLDAVDPADRLVGRPLQLSALAQVTHIGDGADDTFDATVERLGLPRDDVAATPFVLIGSCDEVVDKLLRLRDELGIHHYVVRDPEGFSPVVDALAER